MENRIKAVIFDLGRVLIDFDHRLSAQKISDLTGKSAEDVYRLFFDSRLIQRFEEGKLSADAFFREVKKLLGLEVAYDEFLPVWNRIFFLTEENKQVYALAKFLKKRYTVALLSNINCLHHAYLKETFPVFDAFHRIFTSYELGHIKPDPQIYCAVLAALAIQPHEAFYVDDRAELIEQAARLGIHSYIYKGVAQLKSDLASCGIDCPPA
ncbi:MAG: HAD family phosphatase [Candidatus Omnitrophica bacterium]|nr:HAD family phosphatase [Candidatus Omnitrophota bacterium]